MTNEFNQDELKAPIAKKIELLERQIAAYTITSQESAAAGKIVRGYLDDLDNAKSWTEEQKEEFNRATHECKRENDERELEQYKRTMELQLMRCDKRYVVTNTKHLHSPAGFHPDDKIFEQTAIAIHTDSLKSLPGGDARYAFEVSNID